MTDSDSDLKEQDPYSSLARFQGAATQGRPLSTQPKHTRVADAVAEGFRRGAPGATCLAKFLTNGSAAAERREALGPLTLRDCAV